MEIKKILVEIGGNCNGVPLTVIRPFDGAKMAGRPINGARMRHFLSFHEGI